MPADVFQRITHNSDNWAMRQWYCGTQEDGEDPSGVQNNASQRTATIFNFSAAVGGAHGVFILFGSGERHSTLFAARFGWAVSLHRAVEVLQWFARFICHRCPPHVDVFPCPHVTNNGMMHYCIIRPRCFASLILKSS